MSEKPAKKDKTTKAKSKSTKAKAAPAKKATNSDIKSIVIAVVCTILVCFAIVFAMLIGTGIIKFNNGSDDNDSQNSGSYGTIIDNPDKMPKMGGNLVSLGDLQFYLPYSFENGGKNDDGAYTFNLVNDSGWAQVLVYVERSNLEPAKYIEKISNYLDITNSNYTINGTTWVQAENADDLAYATKLDGVIYAIYYNVKADSATTAQAMSMIPKTLYMKKIYQRGETLMTPR